MIKIDYKKIACLIITFVFLISTNVFALKNTDNLEQDSNEIDKNSEMQTTALEDDIDPLVDLTVTFTVKEIRALDKIDRFGDADFYVKILINGVEQTSPIWRDKNYVKPNWSTTLQDVPDDQEFVNITIQLWDWNLVGNKLCDISPNSEDGDYTDEYDVDLRYSLKSGHWMDEDYNNPGSDYQLFDRSGYGRLNGCDDNTIYQNDKDCELFFDITQNDYDGDGIPYWTEVNIFGTDPSANNLGWDNDSDGIPIEWEYKWGHYFSHDWHHHEIENRWVYDPFTWDDFKNMDFDEDGLDNVEEYLTAQWKSDPFRKDIFIEIDQMEIGPNGEGGFFPEFSKYLLTDTFSRHNIVLHIDDGCMGGGEMMIPFDDSTSDNELQNLYFNYFLNGDPNYWRRGVFHYALVIYHSARFPGFVFGTTADGEHYLLDSLQISTKQHEKLPPNQGNPFYNLLMYKSSDKKYQKTVVYAGAIIHETGHTLGLFGGVVPGVDDNDLKFFNYKSSMNYRYIYYMVDYSDGSHGKNDFDDWDFIDLTRFQK